MLGRRSLLVLALLGGCVCEPDHLVDDAYAPATPYGPAIDACITKHDCDPLCMSLFVLGLDQSLVSCAVDHVDAQGTAHVEMRSDDYGVCAADPGYYGDDGSTDTGDYGSTDTGDDGSCNDSSCDPGDDGSFGDDGSTDDGSTDDGSTDDGSTDDGGDTGDDGGDSGDGGDTGDGADWIYHPGSTPVKPPGIRAFHVSGARR